MLPYKIIGALALIVIITILLALLSIHLSLWFLWELLPPDGAAIQLAVNQRHPAASTLTDQLAATQLAPALKPLKNARRFALSQTHNSTTVIAVSDKPFLFRSQRALSEQLKATGFHTQRLGLLVIAQKSSSTESTLIVPTKIGQAAHQTTRRLFSSTLPSTPFLIAELDAGTTPFFDNALTILGTAKGRDVKLIAAEQTINFHSLPHTTPPLPNNVDELSMTLPSHILATLPDSLHHNWNSALIQRLSFFNTRPDIIAHLARYNSPVIIKLNNSHATIAVAGSNEQFTSAIHSWFQNEEAYSRQRQQAFRLPDGTLGYELAPGEIREVFTNLVDSNCRQESWPRLAGAGGPAHNQAMQHLWLCTKGNQIAFGSDQSATKEATQDDFSAASTWNISLGAQYLADLSLSGIESISASGTETQAIIHLQLRDTL